MLDIAQKHSDVLRYKLADITYDEKYMFFTGGWNNEYKSADSTWNEHEFVSLSSDGEVIGYIGYDIDRNSYKVSSLKAINFSEDKMTFGRDLIQVIRDIFLKFGFRKLSFGVYVGNPIEKTYDKLVDKYGGRIVGVKKEDSRLLDGKIYDYKLYEILKSDFKYTDK